MNTFKQFGLLSGILLAMHCYADSPPFAENKQQEFYIGTWTASAPDGLGALKSDFPSQGIYKVRLNADGTIHKPCLSISILSTINLLKIEL
ncbi:hypothetical protein [Acinetobacter sp.]|uniref:hypothetical protein n=1 Tax=Acinetobacter sp. TaxID=472 RepID=UPI003341F848